MLTAKCTAARSSFALALSAENRSGTGPASRQLQEKVGDVAPAGFSLGLLWRWRDRLTHPAARIAHRAKTHTLRALRRVRHQLESQPSGRVLEANRPASSVSPCCDAPSPWLRQCRYRGQSVCSG